MNFIIILVITAAIGAGWFVATRLIGPNAKINKTDPVNAERRYEWLRATRDLTFFFIVYVIATTVLVFAAAAIFAAVDPPDKFSFGNSFTKIINSLSEPTGALSPTTVWSGLLALAVSAVSVFVSQRVARGQSIKSLGLGSYKALPLDIVMGLLLGPIVFGVITAFTQLTGILAGTRGPNFNWLELGKWLIIYACVAVAEELVVRGYILQTLNQAFGGVVAIIGSSVFWGVAHLFNPNSSLVAAINIAFAGVVFAYAYYITGHLWLPILFHFSWNFAEGAIFGYPVSGFEVATPIQQPFLDGPETLTGGRFGPEGGLIGLIGIVVAAIVLYGWSRVRQPAK